MRRLRYTPFRTLKFRCAAVPHRLKCTRPSFFCCCCCWLFIQLVLCSVVHADDDIMRSINHYHHHHRTTTTSWEKELKKTRIRPHSWPFNPATLAWLSTWLSFQCFSLFFEGCLSCCGGVGGGSGGGGCCLIWKELASLHSLEMMKWFKIFPLNSHHHRPKCLVYL